MKSRRAWQTVLVLAACAGIVTTMAGAHGGNISLIHACINKTTKLVRIVAPTKSCKASETAKHWAIQGPAGPKGDTGDTGLPGPSQPPVEPYAGDWWLSVNDDPSPIHSLDGCVPVADLIEEAAGSDNVVHKHIGNPKPEDCSIEVGLEMSHSLREWIAQMLDPAGIPRHNMTLFKSGGPVITAHDVLMESLQLPPLDASDSAPAYIRLVLRPETIDISQADPGAIPPAALKPLDPSTVDLSLDGVGGDLASRVESWKLSMEITEGQIGAGRDHTLEPGKHKFANLLFRDPETDSSGNDALGAWWENFVILGNNSQADEKSATITVGDGAGSTLTLSFTGVGIFRADPAARTDGARRYSLYVEGGSLDVTSPG